MVQFLIGFIFSLLVLIFLILKFKVHPILALFISAFLLGISVGYPILETLEIINKGFGSTLTGIGLPIILGAILAIGIIDLRAADSIVNLFDKVFKGKRMELASSLTAFIISIPVFGDITNLLVAPIASRIAHLKKISMTTMVAFTGLGLILTHGLVPPTPGILATSLNLEADLGMVIIFGTITSFIALFLTWITFEKWIAKDFVKPLERLSGANETNKEAGDSKSKKIPYLLAFLPILLPVVFIASSTIVEMLMGEGSALSGFMDIIGDRVVALSSGVIMIFILAFMYKQNVYKSAIKEDKSVHSNTSFLQIIMHSWVARALSVAMLPLLVTAMSGAIASIISENENVELLANKIVNGYIPYVLIPYLIAAIMVAIVGSITTAALTAAGIVGPMIAVLGLSPELTALAIGAGSLAFIHTNNSGFWIQVELFNVTTKQGLKYITLPTFFASVVSIVVLSLFHIIGLL